MSASNDRPPLLGGMAPGAFLREHWQRRPLLVRGALPGLGEALAPDELAGLATDPDAISRLVLGDGASGVRELRHGPFDDDELRGLPERDWTLLVQEVDRHVEPVADVLEQVRFLPGWRIDDVMVSVAAPGGGVGPHVDRYDVFLIQAAGRRRWAIEERPRPPGGGPVARARDERSADLPALEAFAPDRVWDLDAGDVLYLPPGLAHDGVSLELSTTWSIGFRAPSAADLLASLLETAGPAARDRRYVDPPLTPRGDDPGRLDALELERGREVLRELVDDDRLWIRAMGRAATLPVRRAAVVADDEDDGGWSPDALRAALRDGARLDRRSPGELAWARGAADEVLLFASGEPIELPAAGEPWARLIAGGRRLDGPALRGLLDEPRALALLTELLARGTLIVLDPPEHG